MTDHPALQPGRTAVVTGAASGIGLAAARRFAARGMNVCLADLPGEALDQAAALLAAEAPAVLAVPTDVSRFEAVEALKEAAYARFGEVGVLVNNAGTAPGGGPYDHLDRWRTVLGVNLWGVIHGVQAFVPAMLAQGTSCAVVNTGSKQGITCPPGDTAYNVSKAGLKVLTEGLAHSLRNEPGGRVTAHLLIPGSTFTGMTRRNRAGGNQAGRNQAGGNQAGGNQAGRDQAEKPPGAWTPDQVVDMLVEGMNRGDFYILCPDNEVTRGIDERRIAWAAGDIIENRPALSRWHPDHKEAFARFLGA